MEYISLTVTTFVLFIYKVAKRYALNENTGACHAIVELFCKCHFPAKIRNSFSSTEVHVFLCFVGVFLGVFEHCEAILLASERERERGSVTRMRTYSSGLI